MTEKRDLYDLVTPMAEAQLDAALLDMTGDLDKVKVLHATLPHWLVRARPQLLSDLQQAHADSAQVRENLRERLSRLQPLDKFCVEQLKTCLAAHGHTTLDVERDYLEIPRREPLNFAPSITGLLIETAALERRSLVRAAMQNFSAAEAQADGLPQGSVLRTAQEEQVIAGLTAAQFVQHCRALDLGGAYQAHIRDVFELPAPGETPVSLSYNQAALAVGQGKASDMQVDLHIALARGHISEATHARLLKLIKADLPAGPVESAPLGERLIWQGLNIDGACLWSVLLFGDAEPGKLPSGAVTVYLPNEPVRPWYEYPSLDDFKQYLALKLQVRPYRKFFKAYLSEAQRLDFFRRFDQDHSLGDVTPSSVTSNFSDFFFRACIGKIQLDSQVLAVPVAEVDEEARQQRLLDYLNVGLDVLNLAAFVVPVLGQLMMGVAVGQLLGEVFEGVEDWNHHDHAQALEHLINVAQGIGSMLLFTAGGHVVGSIIRPVATSAPFFEQVEAVTRHDHQPRLWRPRLSSYRQLGEMPQPWLADGRGVHQAQGKSYVKLDGEVYHVDYDPAVGEWRINHPTRPGAYRPPVRHNFQGGWQHLFERPAQWQEARYNLLRIDPQLSDLPTEALDSLAAITELEVGGLQRLAQAHEPLPERFHDSVARYRQHLEVEALCSALESGETPAARTGRTQMLALPLVEGWPPGRFFELLDSHGNRLESYPDLSPFDFSDQSIHITEQQLYSGQVMSTLLEALSVEQRETLLGEAVELEQAQPLLMRRLLTAVRRNHRELSRQLYARLNGAALGELAPLCAGFDGLSNRVAWELLAGASTAQRRYLRSTGRVPLMLAQRTREALDVMAMDQALMGLHWPFLADAATHRVAVGMLERLQGWPRDLLLQVREASLDGEVLEQTGPATASVRRTVVRSNHGFQAFDEQGQDLDTWVDGPLGLYQAILDSLSAAQRRAMKLQGETPAEQLRYRLSLKARDERQRLPRYLWPERPVPEELPDACALAQVRPPAEFAPALVRKVKKLYPALTEYQVADLLRNSGDDHLSRAKAIEALEQQFQRLHQALKRWRSDTSGHRDQDGPLWDYRLSRHQAMRAIERSWRGLSMCKDQQLKEVPGLVLDGIILGALPALPPDVRFDQVQHLSLRDMGLNDDVAYFLKHFKGLRTLELNGNQLSRLPEALSLMPELEHLYLAGNRLLLTEHTRKKLADLRGLKTLSMAGNPLLNAPDVGHLFDLRALILRDCQLKEFPAGVQRLPYLEHVDLRQNNISTLPDWLPSLPRSVAQAFNLRHNPLSATSEAGLRSLRRRTGLGLGFVHDDIGRINEQKARELWMVDERMVDFAEKDLVWTGLKNAPGSDGLFRLLAEMGGTADAQQVREDLQRRIWRVLDAAAGDAELREELFDRAATPLNCDDAAAVNFSNLEIVTEIGEARRLLANGRITARPLLKLARGLFRLDRLERIARQHSSEHPASDPLEVSLAYRTGLVDRFYLPGQPQHMRFARLGGVTQAALDSAEGEVKTAELSPELMTFMLDLPFWKDYLQRTFARRFEAVNGPLEQRMLEVFEQRLTLDDATYFARANDILAEQQLLQKAELQRLTEECIRLDDLQLCASIVP
ncbi:MULTISPECIES: NEL-type E3 ubiquitin ligase domain-containing protein [Pseudomonas]|uniref:RING-type E3 ubiquitin transferase n=1 Tax=Pseudomonas azadiae TaxID=2843612 RepID=A0ABS6NU68_9PSED|nr:MULTISPECIES: NEL-type E3 ubiquitin ligase domain-containing protein [Pseudomonas]MBV4451756.1 hypothetical protein [Pseudomonas azadiae]NMF39554.1 hypothetical protein [Pseudomonas sp. SWRI 103]